MNLSRIAAELNLMASAALTMQPEHACLSCGRTYVEPVDANGCYSDDCPGHDLAADAGGSVADPYEELQDAEELRMIRAEYAPRRMRSFHY